MALDQQLALNLGRLARAPENEPFRKWLERERDVWRDLLETTRDPGMIGVAQGRAQMLGDIQKLLQVALQVDK